jgi:hypothetical protein
METNKADQVEMGEKGVRKIGKIEILQRKREEMFT